MQINKFKVGDTVQVAHDRTYFSTVGIDMVITDIIHEDIDGNLVAIYNTDHNCPVHGAYNDFELVAVQ